MTQRYLSIGLLIVYALLVFLLTGPPELGWNEASRLATVQSLVEKGTLSIDESSFVTGDKSKFRGSFYSDKPPLPSLMGAAIYGVAYHGLGISFERNMELAYRLVTFFTVGFPLCVMLVIFYRASAKMGLSAGNQLALSAVLGLGTLLLGYGTVFNNHVPTAVFLFLCFAAVLVTAERNQCSDKRYPFLAGLCCAASLACDSSAGLFFVFLACYLLFLNRDYLYWFTWGALGPVLVYMIYNVYVTGDIFPAYMHPEGYNYPGSQMALTLGGSAPTTANHLRYLIESQFGVAGFLSNTPILLLGIAGCVGTLFRHQNTRMRYLAGLILVGSAGVALFYALRSSNFGGYSFGFRYLLPVTPLLVFYMAYFLQTTIHRGMLFRIVFILLLIPSLAFSALCVMQPWQPTSQAVATSLEKFSPGLGEKAREIYRRTVGRDSVSGPESVIPVPSSVAQAPEGRRDMQ